MTLTVTFILKITILLNVATVGIRVSQKPFILNTLTFDYNWNDLIVLDGSRLWPELDKKKKNISLRW